MDGMLGRPWKILLVEDDEDDFILTQILLSESKGANFDLHWISTYEAAVKTLRSEKFDVILVDYLLDTRNGLDLVREAVAMGCRAPIIVLTGQGSYEIDLLAMQSGAVDYLVKGQINGVLLERTIRYAIERRHSQEALRRAHDELEIRVQQRTQELMQANEELQAEIAERKRGEAQLRVQTTALEAAANGIFITDRDGQIVWCNPAFSRMSGYTAAEVIGKNPRILKSGVHDLEFYQHLWNTILSGQVWHGETTNRRKDGSLYTSEQTLTPVGDESGQISAFIAIKHDITKRKRAEALVRQNAHRSEILADISRTLVETGADYKAIIQVITQKIATTVGDYCAIYLLSSDGIWLTPVAYHHPNSAASEHLKAIMDLGPTDSHAGLIGQVIKTGRGVLISSVESVNTVAVPRPEYRQYLERFGLSSVLAVPLSVHGKLIGAMIVTLETPGQCFDVDDQVMVQSIADRTALAIANAQLYQDLQSALQEEQTMRRQLVQAEKHSAMSRMVASVAHELNNPIQTIQNCLFLINQDILPESEMASFIEMAISETRRVSNLVSQLREIYRPSKTTPMQPTDVFRLLDEVHVLLVPHLQHQNVEWAQSSDIQPETAAILGIADQIKQVFLNICLNAIEAMQPEGGVLAITVSSAAEKCEVGISFRDTGPGIPEQYLSQVFEPFFTTKDSGTGLGLSICYDIIERHAGQITVESTPGNGAEFTIWLPLAAK